MLSMLSLSREFVDAIRQAHGNELRKIKLSNNGLKDVRNIEHLSPVLAKLDLSCNDLADLRPLSVLTSLEELDLSENRVEDVAALAQLPRLRCLRLQGNCLARLQALEPLRNASALRELSLQGNGLCTEGCNTGDDGGDGGGGSYPLNVFKLLPQVELVDQWYVPVSSTAVPSSHFESLTVRVCVYLFSGPGRRRKGSQR
jgi:hypothetical protein